MIKKIILTLSFVIFLSANATAGMSCKYDYLGNYVCNGTGNDYGYSTKTKKDYLGNDRTTDNQGNSYTCKYDYLGNYVCN
jgi:hypothetical protein